MNVKSGCEKAEARRRRDAALRRQTHMDMSNTPFTNIETCNGGLAEDNRSRAYETTTPTALSLQFYVPSADRGGYVAHETPRDNSQPGTPSKIVSTLLEILVKKALQEGKQVYIGRKFQPFLRFYTTP